MNIKMCSKNEWCNSSIVSDTIQFPNVFAAILLLNTKKAKRSWINGCVRTNTSLELLPDHRNYAREN